MFSTNNDILVLYIGASGRKRRDGHVNSRARAIVDRVVELVCISVPASSNILSSHPKITCSFIGACLVGIRCSVTRYSGCIRLNLGLNSLAIRDIGTSYGAQFTDIRVD